MWQNQLAPVIEERILNNDQYRREFRSKSQFDQYPFNEAIGMTLHNIELKLKEKFGDLISYNEVDASIDYPDEDKIHRIVQRYIIRESFTGVSVSDREEYEKAIEQYNNGEPVDNIGKFIELYINEIITAEIVNNPDIDVRNILDEYESIFNDIINIMDDFHSQNKLDLIQAFFGKEILNKFEIKSLNNLKSAQYKLLKKIKIKEIVIEIKRVIRRINNLDRYVQKIIRSISYEINNNKEELLKTKSVIEKYLYWKNIEKQAENYIEEALQKTYKDVTNEDNQQHTWFRGCEDDENTKMLDILTNAYYIPDATNDWRKYIEAYTGLYEYSIPINKKCPNPLCQSSNISVSVISVASSDEAQKTLIICRDCSTHL